MRNISSIDAAKPQSETRRHELVTELRHLLLSRTGAQEAAAQAGLIRQKKRFAERLIGGLHVLEDGSLRKRATHPQRAPTHQQTSLGQGWISRRYKTKGAFYETVDGVQQKQHKRGRLCNMSELELGTMARYFQLKQTAIADAGLYDRYKQKKTTDSWESAEQNAYLGVQTTSGEMRAAAVAV